MGVVVWAQMGRVQIKDGGARPKGQSEAAAAVLVSRPPYPTPVIALLPSAGVTSPHLHGVMPRLRVSRHRLLSAKQGPFQGWRSLGRWGCGFGPKGFSRPTPGSSWAFFHPWLLLQICPRPWFHCPARGSSPQEPKELGLTAPSTNTHPDLSPALVWEGAGHKPGPATQGDPHQMRGCERCSQFSSCFLGSGYACGAGGSRREAPPLWSTGRDEVLQAPTGTSGPLYHSGGRAPSWPLPAALPPTALEHSLKQGGHSPACPPTHEWFPVGVVEWAENLVTRNSKLY